MKDAGIRLLSRPFDSVLWIEMWSTFEEEEEYEHIQDLPPPPALRDSVLVPPR